MARAVLITGARAAAALDLARAFLAVGWDVHLADSVKVRMARWSRLDVRHHSYPPPRRDASRFRAAITGLVERHGIELVVPTCEEVFHLAAPALHGALGSRLFAPDMATLRLLHDKFAFATACREWGLDAPESHAIDSAETLASFMPTSQNWVFKPRFSRFGDRTLIGPTPTRLEASGLVASGGWMAQRRIEGEEACLHAIARDGVLTGFTAYNSRWRMAGGASYAFEHLDDWRAGHLRNIAAKIASNAHIHGQFACDVIVDRGGQPWLLECNPRATSGVHLLIAQGAIVGAITGQAQCTAINELRPAFLGPAMWVLGLPQAIRTGRFREWRAAISQGRDVISQPDDRVPALGALVDAAMFSLKGLAKGISTNAATTCDIEWNGEELV